MVRWYMLRVRGGGEEKIKQTIQETILSKSLNSYFGEIIAPYEKVYIRDKGKKIIKKKYLSYIFVALDLEKKPMLRDILISVKGVYGFVGLSGWGYKQEPVPVQPQEIDLMLGKMQEVSETTGLVDQNFVEGQKVKIIRAPFENSVGTIKKVAKGQRKLTIAIKLFKQDLTELELSYAEVQRID